MVLRTEDLSGRITELEGLLKEAWSERATQIQSEGNTRHGVEVKGGDSVQLAPESNGLSIAASATEPRNALRTTSSPPAQCLTIHVGFMLVGVNHVRSSMAMLKSLLFHRSSKLVLHIITDQMTQHAITTLFDSWAIPDLLVRTYTINQTVIEQIGWVPNHHYGGLYALLKLTVLQVLPSWLERIAIIDTDLIFTRDIRELWLKFVEMDEQQCLAMVENQSGKDGGREGESERKCTS